MTGETYLRQALLVPILAPFAAWTAGIIIPTVPTVAAAFAGILGLVYFGVPYLVTAGIAVAWSRRRTESELRRCAWVAPFVFAPLAAIGYWCGVTAMQGSAASSRDAFVVAVIALVLGYLYVRVVLSSLDVARRRGRIEPQASRVGA